MRACYWLYVTSRSYEPFFSGKFGTEDGIRKEDRPRVKEGSAYIVSYECNNKAPRTSICASATTKPNSGSEISKHTCIDSEPRPH